MRWEPLLRDYGDPLLAVALTALIGLELSLDEEIGAAERAAGFLALAALAVLVAVRTRLPVLLLAALALPAAAEPWLAGFGDYDAVGLVVLLAVYTAAAHTAGASTWIAAGLTVSLGTLVAVTDPEELNVAGAAFFAVAFAAPWAAGRAIRRRRLREARLERDKRAAEEAVAEERARIARELHDVVAHAISVVVLQARGGRRLLASAPDESREAFTTIERTAEQALGEMRRLLGLLRDGDEQLLHAPQPSLTRVDELADRVRASGLPVELTVEGEPVELPPGVDVSAYRIVQEALTNALKHAGPTRARVLVRYADGAVEVEVADDGRGNGDGGGSGHGLVGIRERVAVYGGDFEAGGSPGGGYAVRARLPYGAAR
jgi:signal transduction histidine kinase